jgi:signal transduction histidine kinase
VIDWKRRCELLEHELVHLVDALCHDLRAPLRAADGFSRAVLVRHASGLDADAQDYLQRIRAATAEMGDLVEALARLARIATADLHPERLDLAALAEEVVAELRRSEPGRDVQVQIARGLELTGDRRLITTLVRSLLDNAWRFTRPKQPAQIEVGRREDGSETVFYVRDTGIGFDMAHARHLFEPFGRLHHPGDHPEAAVGLAIARRIVHRHGGRIWAESAPGQGATFHFTVGEPG